MLLLSICGVPIAFSLLFAGFGGLFFLRGLTVANTLSLMAPLGPILGGDLATLPLFILLGSFALASGVTEDGFAFARAWLGRLPGGLGISTIAASAFFAACSGSSIASAMTIGKMAIPEMRRAGYHDSVATGTAAAGGLLATMIPPSGAMVVYGLVSGESIGRLLIAGAIPGVIIALTFTLALYLQSTMNPASVPLVQHNFTWRQRFATIPRTWGILVIFLTIFLGIFTGIFTASEAAAFGASVALLLVVLKKRKQAGRALVDSCYDCAIGTASIVFLFFCAFVFSSFLVLAGLPQAIAETVTSSGLPPLTVVGLILLSYLVMGCFMDGMTMMLITIPIYHPIVLDLGFSGIWFGVLVIAMAEIGMLTPPFGIVAFTIAGVAPDIDLAQIFKGSMIFVLMELMAVVLVLFFPVLATWLPSLMR
jgi:tripartite ATP-independent transporter DctM subunit